MQSSMTYNHILENVDNLSLDEQESLVETVRRRLIERRREEIANDIETARQEFREGKAIAVTVEEVVNEIIM